MPSVMTLRGPQLEGVLGAQPFPSSTITHYVDPKVEAVWQSLVDRLRAVEILSVNPLSLTDAESIATGMIDAVLVASRAGTESKIPEIKSGVRTIVARGTLIGLALTITFSSLAIGTYKARHRVKP